MRSNIGTAPALPHTPFHSQPLRRVLTDWAGTGAAPQPGAPDDLAERLGDWLGWTDAIALSAALHQAAMAAPHLPDTAAAAPAAGRPATAQLRQALARLQADQERLITTDPVYLSGNGLGADDAGDGTPYRRAAQARQRAMAAAIGPLRARLRAALAQASPVLARLAALDAALEAALAERERHLLDGVAQRIAQRCAAARAEAEPASSTGWRLRFHQDMQRVLLAELNLRLQPLEGLLAALRQEQPA